MKLKKITVLKEWITLSPVKLSDIDEPTKEIQIAKIGKFKHPKYGNFEITQETLDQFVQNFDDNALGKEVMMNFEHGNTEKFGTISAGDFKSLVSRDGMLFAVIHWTERALEHIKNREFKYISPEIFFQWANETGKKFKNIIAGAALTNTPWFKGMARVDATEKPEQEREPNMTLAELLAKLFSDHNINVKELQSIAEKYSTQSLVFTESENRVVKLTSDLATMATRATDAEKKFGEVAFDALVKKGMEAGKLTKAQAEGSFKEVFEKMGAEFSEKWIESAPKVVDLSDTKGHAKSKEDDGKSKLNAAETLVDSAQKLAVGKGLNFSEALAAVSLTDSAALDAYDAHVMKQMTDEMP